MQRILPDLELLLLTRGAYQGCLTPWPAPHQHSTHFVHAYLFLPSFANSIPMGWCKCLGCLTRALAHQRRSAARLRMEQSVS